MTRRLAIRVVGLLLSLACLAYFAYSAAQALTSAGSRLELRPIIAGLAIALPPYLLGYMAFALLWHSLLRGLGVVAAPAATFGIFFTSQFGKYLPGNVAHHAGRVLLSKKFGYPLSSVGVAMVLEMLVTMAAAAVLCVPLSASLAALLHRHASPGVLFAAAIVITVLALCASWILAHRGTLRHLLARLRPIVDAMRPVRAIPILVRSWLLATAAIVLCAGSLGILGAGDYPELLSTYGYVVALFSVAWIAGLLTPGAPAGLGVREVILMEGLSSQYGQVDATAATILFRLLTVAADLIALGAGAFLLRTAVSRQQASVEGK